MCTVELCSFTEDYAAFRDADTEVLPISVDSIPTLQEFKAKERISVDLLSDFKREVSRRYGTLLEDRFHSNRAYVLIDRTGSCAGHSPRTAPATGGRTPSCSQQIRALK